MSTLKGISVNIGSMFLAFFESIKHIGHFWPIALLRIYLGYFFLNAGMSKISAHYLTEPVLQETLYKWMSQGINYPNYLLFLQNVVLPHYQVFSYLVVLGEIAVGLSFIFGFFVRPAAVGAIIMNINFLLAAGLEAKTVNSLMIAMNLTLFFTAAGRCFGFDYYFYKKYRGIWW